MPQTVPNDKPSKIRPFPLLETQQGIHFSLSVFLTSWPTAKDNDNSHPLGTSLKTLVQVSYPIVWLEVLKCMTSRVPCPLWVFHDNIRLQNNAIFHVMNFFTRNWRILLGGNAAKLSRNHFSVTRGCVWRTPARTTTRWKRRGPDTVHINLL